MNDKDLIIKLISQQAAKIGKVVFPSMPVIAMETLVTLGINNQADKYEHMIGFLFDKDGNLPSPDEFWQVAKSVMNDKPINIPAFGKVIRINGDDVEEIRKNFVAKKQ